MSSKCLGGKRYDLNTQKMKLVNFSFANLKSKTSEYKTFYSIRVKIGQNSFLGKKKLKK
jgi:hypothetical protein